MKKILAVLMTIAMILSLLAGMAAAEAELKDVVCKEGAFATKIPAGTSAAYGEDEKGLVIYAATEGSIPYVIVSRRPLEYKFSDPVDFLNNTFRENIENAYGDDCLGMNPAKNWEVGGKELLGAKYMYKIGDHTVTLIRLIEVRDGGDVEYTIKYVEDDDQAVMAVADAAVRYYQETDSSAVATEVPAETKAPAETSANSSEGQAPSFLTPVEFVSKYNVMISVLADSYAEDLGEEGVNTLNEFYTITEADPQGQILYYGNKDWSIESGFMYAEEKDGMEETPALVVNFNLKTSLPETVVYLAKYALKMMIAYEYQDVVSLDALTEWFNTADDPANIFELPGGYTLNILKGEQYTQYCVLPPAELNPYAQSAE
jgi:hypothetical protein